MRRWFFAVCLTPALVAGCTGPQYQTRSFADEAFKPYTLASGDRLRVIVFGQDSLSNSYSVDSVGNISMPLIGAVRAQGRSAHDLEGEIAAKLRSGFLRDPKVSAEVEAYRPFFVLGEVTTAGQYPFVNGLTVQNAVAIAGGFSPRASKSSVNLTRIINGVPVTYAVPVTDPVRPGDTIMVRERFF